MLKLSLNITPIILAATLISGCASEFMKGTPAYSGKLVYGVARSGERVRWNDSSAEKIEELDMSKNLNRLDADRVNVWPLVYYNFPVTSIFWPCAEINDKGWAARPFITANNYDQDYYYMMWLGNIDNKNQSSYFFPVYYNSKDSFVSLPCFWNKKTLGVIPPLFLIGDRDEAPAYNFLFPFAQYIPSENSSYVFPLYYKSEEIFLFMHGLGFWSDKSMAIVPPLFVMTDRDKQPAYHIMFPMGKYDSSDGTNYFIPLYYSDNDRFYTLLSGWEKDEYFYIGGPLFIVNNKNVYHIMWPFIRLCPEKSEYRFEPLFDYEPAYGGYDFTYLLFFGQIWNNNNSSGSYFFPLYKYKMCQYSKLDSLLTPLFGIYDKGESFYALPPFYFFNREKDYSDSHIMFPFGKLRVMHEPDENVPEYQGHAFPFYGRYKDNISDSRWLMWPFFFHSEKYILTDLRTKKERKDKNSKPKIERKFKEETVMSLPFYYYQREPDSYYRNFFGFAGNSHETIAGKERDSIYVLPFYLNTWQAVFDTPCAKYYSGDSDFFASSRNLQYYFPFVATSEYPEKNEFNLMVLPFFYFYSSTPEEKSNSAFLWFFTRNEDFKKKSIMSQAMWFMFYYKDQQKTETEEAFTSFRVFGKLYHREAMEGKLNVDVFPFIKYSEEKKESGFSFAWRFFNVKNDENGLNRLDIFFIPFYRR